MRYSLIIAAHNEGDLLVRTVAACCDSLVGERPEIIASDDASTDGSLAAVESEFPWVRTIRHPERLGPAPTKHAAAEAASGETLIFLDAHCKPERGALEGLVDNVESHDGRVLFMPALAQLDVVSWENDRNYVGLAGELDLLSLEWRWLDFDELRREGPYVESPSAIGSCLAVSRSTYFHLGGFDAGMRDWGLEDGELGLKAWMLGHPVWTDPRLLVGHRFQQGGKDYAAGEAQLLANKLRTGCKIFGAALWPHWLDRVRSGTSPDIWQEAWLLFQDGRGSAERERAFLQGERVHDEFSYAARFGLPWPVRPRT